MNNSYDWRGGRQLLFTVGGRRFGCIVAALPPFEEGNRTRTLVMGVLGRMAAAGWSIAVPELPGAGESLQPTEAATLADWRDAFATAVGRLPGPIHLLSVRAGALIESAAPAESRWRLAPLDGPALLRELMRTGQAGAREAGTPWPPADDALAIIAGNPISAALRAELAVATGDAAGPVRVARLADDPAAADVRLPGAPLWRQAEPADDPELADAIAADFMTWLATCGG